MVNCLIRTCFRSLFEVFLTIRSRSNERTDSGDPEYCHFAGVVPAGITMWDMGVGVGDV
jgi:hypothetical protein